MIRFYIYVTIVFISLGTIYAQDQYSLTGQVVDQEGKSLLFASTLLLTAGDSTMVEGAITNEAGRYVFKEVPSGTYNVAVSMVGYESFKTKPFVVRPGFSSELPVIVLTEGIALGEVQVTSTKLLYELQQDRMVMNVDAFPAMSGNTALELLQKVPGVIVDRQNNSIGMNAKGEVLIM